MPEPNRNHSKTKMPEEVHRMLSNLVMDIHSIAFRGDTPASLDAWESIDTSEIDDALNALENSIRSERNSGIGENSLARAMMARKYERIVTAVIVLTMLDAGLSMPDGAKTLPKPVAKPEHLDWAIRYTDAITDTILYQSADGSLSDVMTKVLHDLVERLPTTKSKMAVNFDSHYVGQTLKVHKSLITGVLNNGSNFNTMKKNDYWNNAAKTRSAVLEEAVDRNILIPAGGSWFYLNPHIEVEA